MKRKIMALSILLGVFLLVVCAASQGSSWVLEKKLNPEEKKWWGTVVDDKEIWKFYRTYMRKYHLSWRSSNFGGIAVAEGYSIESSSPLIMLFSPDQISLEKVHPKYHYLFVIPISEIEEILAEKKCVIVSRKVKINVARHILDDKGEWTVVSETEGEGYVTLVAAPNKRSLKKTITRFFTLTEIPLKPLIWHPK